MPALENRQLPADEGRATRPWIASAAVAVGLIGFLLLWIWYRNSESRALRGMPAAERAALYQRTAEDLRTLCGPERAADLADHCRKQATFLLRFPSATKRARGWPATSSTVDEGGAYAARLVISLERIATLDVAAASGLCRIGDELIVVADDELTLHRYGLDGSPRGRIVVVPGSLPDEARARKRAKPDFEALTALPGGSLLAVGSGSAPGRERAAWIDLAAGAARIVDLGPLYAALRERIEPLNVEGACPVGDSLVLLTRRTGRAGANTVVRLGLDAALAALAVGRLDPGLVRGVEPVELSSMGGAPLGFTDAAPWRGGALYAAAAEVTDDPVEDGACVGCELGWIDPDGRVAWREPVEPCVKLEGITIDPDGVIHAVADGDDRAVLAPLFRARIPIRT